MDSQLKYGNRVLRMLSYIDNKINPEKYIQKGGARNETPNVLKVIDFRESADNKTTYITVQINDKTKITFTVTSKLNQ